MHISLLSIVYKHNLLRSPIFMHKARTMSIFKRKDLLSLKVQPSQHSLIWPRSPHTWKASLRNLHSRYVWLLLLRWLIIT